MLTSEESPPSLPPSPPPDLPIVDEPIHFSVYEAIETSLTQNPDLIALRATEEVSQAALGVAETYPFNPFIQVQATPFQNDPNTGGSGNVYHYVLIMQQIQLAHQQSYREETAGAMLDSVRWNILQQQLLTVAQTERLFFTAAYQRGLRDLTQAAADNNQELLRILQLQLDAGEATAADVAMVRLDAQSTDRQLRLAEANYRTALLDLRRQLGLPRDVPLEVDSTMLSAEASLAEPSTLQAERPLSWVDLSEDTATPASLAAGRPDVMAARADIHAARANAGLANASRVPDVQIGPYYQRTLDGSTFLGFRAHTEIQVFNNGKPLLRQREAELRQRTILWRQLQTRAELEAEAALDRYERARQLLTDSDGGDSTFAEFPVELQRLEEQFKAGEVDVLRMFQARNSLIQNRRATLDSLNELYQAAANVTAATGLPLEALMRPAATPQP